MNCRPSSGWNLVSDYSNATSQAAVALTFSDGTKFTDAADSATLDWFPLSSLLSFSSADPSVVEIDGVGTL